MSRSIEIFARSLLASRPHVLSMQGHESVNGLYRFDVRLVLNGPDDLLVDGSIIETPVQLMLDGGRTRDLRHRSSRWGREPVEASLRTRPAN